MNLEQALNKYSEKKIDDIINLMKTNDKVATGTFNQTLNYKIESDVETLSAVISFFGEHYIKHVASGIKPGTIPNIDNIKEWMKARGVPENKLWAVIKSIFEKGITPDSTLQDALSAEYYSDFGGVLQGIMIEDLKIQIEQIIKELNNGTNNN